MFKKDDYMRKIVTSLLIFLLVFTVIILVLFCVTGSEPSTLISAVFAATIGEMGFCSFIKKAKLQKEIKKGEDEYDI